MLLGIGPDGTKSPSWISAAVGIIVWITASAAAAPATPAAAAAAVASWG